MVKKFFGIFAVVAVMAAAGYGVLKNANQNELNDLALANIEALGAGEGDTTTPIYCQGGAVECARIVSGNTVHLFYKGPA